MGFSPISQKQISEATLGTESLKQLGKSLVGLMKPRFLLQHADVTGISSMNAWAQSALFRLQAGGGGEIVSGLFPWHTVGLTVCKTLWLKCIL